jgi:hypothetical protein
LLLSLVSFKGELTDNQKENKGVVFSCFAGGLVFLFGNPAQLRRSYMHQFASTESESLQVLEESL